ncbi:MAG: hypothetical protein GY940_40640 [bacterium]|nr:hypothetical protein [bacterium]
MRRLLALSHQQMSELMAVSETRYRQLEQTGITRKDDPDAIDLEPLYDEYGINMTWLYTGKEMLFHFNSPRIPDWKFLFAVHKLGATPHSNSIERLANASQMPPLAGEILEAIRLLDIETDVPAPPQYPDIVIDVDLHYKKNI